MGKGMLRKWQRPGAGKRREEGEEGQEEGGMGGEIATWRGRLRRGNGDREMGWGAIARGETGKGEGRGNREGEKGQEEGEFHRWI